MKHPAIVQQSSGSTLTGFFVAEVMRRKVVRQPPEASVEEGLRAMIRNRVNGLLVEHDNGQPAGVLSKTDIMGAYYAELPISIQIQDIMSRPVLTCHPQDSLEDALNQMKQDRVTRLFVTQTGGKEVVGVLAYPDVVGLMYRHCHYCRKSLFKGAYISGETSKPILRFSVRDIMGTDVLTLGYEATVGQALEALSLARAGELLIAGEDGAMAGVISVNDLVLAYRHGLKLESEARQIMTSPIRTCREDAMLEEAIQTMIFSDVSRLFVQACQGEEIVGVLSLADAAKARSGSCQACIVSRISLSS